MKYTQKSISAQSVILANDHFVAVPYDCSSITANASGVIPAGTIIPANDSTAIGVLLNDVYKNEDPNGAIVVHGFIKSSALPTAASDNAKSALKQISFI